MWRSRRAEEAVAAQARPRAVLNLPTRQPEVLQFPQSVSPARPRRALAVIFPREGLLFSGANGELRKVKVKTGAAT